MFYSYLGSPLVCMSSSAIIPGGVGDRKADTVLSKLLGPVKFIQSHEGQDVGGGGACTPLQPPVLMLS